MRWFGSVVLVLLDTVFANAHNYIASTLLIGVFITLSIILAIPLFPSISQALIVIAVTGVTMFLIQVACSSGEYITSELSVASRILYEKPSSKLGRYVTTKYKSIIYMATLI